MGMLILTRRTGEETIIGEAGTLYDKHGTPIKITFTVLGVKGNQVRIGIDAPREVRVDRAEIAARIRKEKDKAEGKEVNGNV